MKKRPLPTNRPSRWTLPRPDATSHKYTRGHLLLLGGEEMTGAARLAALAAQRVGTGIVTLAAPVASWPVYAASMMSVVTRKLAKPGDWGWILRHRKVDAVLLGPGSEPLELRPALVAALKTRLPLVLDAGALALLAKTPRLREALREVPCALLPHAGEYVLLAEALGLDAQADKPARARALAAALGVVVVLKGAETIIAAPDGTAVRNSDGPAWLATAGTGDVLAGMVAGLAAQGMPVFDAACAAVWLHAETARAFAPGMIAEDIIDTIPEIAARL